MVAGFELFYKLITLREMIDDLLMFFLCPLNCDIIFKIINTLKN
jgi:hypothetical protein